MIAHAIARGFPFESGGSASQGIKYEGLRAGLSPSHPERSQSHSRTRGSGGEG